MDTALFNIFDLPMVLTIFVSLIIASVLVISRPQANQYLLLAAYLYAIAFVELDKVIFWSMPVHRLFEPMVPVIFALGKCIGLLVPPLLYLYIRAFGQSEKPVSRSDAYLLVIPLSGSILSLLLYLSLGSDPIVYWPSNYHSIFFNPYYIAFMLCKYGLFIAFMAICLKMTWSSLTQGKKNTSPKLKSQKELNLVLLGALCIYAVELLADFLAALETNGAILDTLGITHNYMVLIYVCLILIQMLKRDVFKSLRKPKNNHHAKERLLTHEVKKIHQIMMEHQYYLDANITLQSLAKKLNMPDYQLSSVLNKSFEKNFFDFINYYRTEHAKKLIVTKMDEGYSIMEILYNSGFNSKSAFNRCFKKYTGITPSQYRERLKTTG